MQKQLATYFYGVFEITVFPLIEPRELYFSVISIDRRERKWGKGRGRLLLKQRNLNGI